MRECLSSPRPATLLPRSQGLVGFSDYFDAITLANRVSHRDGFFPEGGAKNVARRTGHDASKRG